MKKILLSVLLCVVLVGVCSAVAFTGYKNENAEEKLTIVYLGDSIAEAILGPSPVSAREDYGYYSVLGKRNNYKFINRSVSGHQTKNMLAYISREDTGATMTQTYLKTADIIHVSILGNDLLQTKMGDTIINTAKNDYTKLNSIKASAAANFEKIVEKLREYNPTAVLMFQNVYNPMYDGSPLLDAATLSKLTELGVTYDKLRPLGAEILSILNSVLTDYLEEHPNAFYVLDAFTEFDRIYKLDAKRGQGLIFTDGVHPSNEGHAVLADLTQRKLEELGLAHRDRAIGNYKDFRNSQLKAYFSTELDLKASIKEINACESCEDITQTYFELIKGLLPKYA